MATRVQNTTTANAVPKKAAAATRTLAKKPTAPNGVKRTPATTKTELAKKSAAPVTRKAASIAGENPGTGVTSAYAIMASRIANRVAEMAESITFVERPRPQEPQNVEVEEKKRPCKLEMRLNGSSPDAIAFSAPFLDNTLQKMLALQNRMLKSTAEMSKAEGVSDKMVKEHAAQSAELSRIIALICAEKARQGV